MRQSSCTNCSFDGDSSSDDWSQSSSPTPIWTSSSEEECDSPDPQGEDTLPAADRDEKAGSGDLSDFSQDSGLLNASSPKAASPMAPPSISLSDSELSDFERNFTPPASDDSPALQSPVQSDSPASSSCPEFLDSDEDSQDEKSATDDELKEAGSLLCLRHQKPLEIWCSDCQMLTCLSCSMIRHRNHVKQDPDQAAEKKRRDMAQRLSELDSAIFRLRGLRNKITEAQARSAQKHKQLTEKIDSTAAHYCHLIRLHQQTLHAQLNQISTEKTLSLQESQQRCSAALSSLLALQEDANKLSQMDPLFLLTMSAEMNAEAKLSDFDSSDEWELVESECSEGGVADWGQLQQRVTAKQDTSSSYFGSMGVRVILLLAVLLLCPWTMASYYPQINKFGSYFGAVRNVVPIQVHDSSDHIRSVLHSGHPWIVFCNQTDSNSKRIREQVAAEALSHSEIRVGVLDCNSRLPSGETAFSHFNWSQSAITPLAFYVANGRRPRTVPFGNLVTDNHASHIVKYVQSQIIRRMYRMTSQGDLESRCFKHQSCLVIYTKGPLQVDQIKMLQETMQEHRSVEVVWVDSSVHLLYTPRKHKDAAFGDPFALYVQHGHLKASVRLDLSALSAFLSVAPFRKPSRALKLNIRRIGRDPEEEFIQL